MATAKQYHPVRRMRWTLIRRISLLIIFVGAAIGWHFWQIDQARLTRTALTWDQLLFDGVLIGLAVLIGLWIVFQGVMRAFRDHRRVLEQAADHASSPHIQPIDIPHDTDPAVAILLQHFNRMSERSYKQQKTIVSSERSHERERDTERATQLIVQQLITNLELEPLLDEFTETLVRSFDISLAAVGFVRDHGVDIRTGYIQDDDGTIEPVGEQWLSLVKGIAGEVAQMHQAVLRQEPPFDTALRAPGSVGTQLAVPIYDQQNLAALLLIQAPTKLDHDHIERLELLAGYLAAALQSTGQYRAANERSTRLSAINDLARAISLSLDIHEIVSRALQQIRQLVSFDQASVTLYDSDQNHFRVLAAIDAYLGKMHADDVFDGSNTPLKTAFEAGHPVYTAAFDDPELLQQIPPFSTDIHSLMVVPLMTNEVRLGTLNLASRTKAAFSDEDITTLSGLAQFLTAALINGRLYQQRSEAIDELQATQHHLLLVEKLRALGELAGGVTHDFNNLLAGVLGNVQILMQEIKDPEHVQTLRLIEKAAKDGASTVKRIQGFARNESEQPDAPVDISELARDALDLTRLRWRNTAQEQGIYIELQKDLHDVPTTRGHAPELREVLTNLIINAVDAMPEGGILRVASGQRGAEVFVSVADTGVGIREDVRSKIFDPFFTTKGDQGNGLGLAVSAAIVQRHGGRIEVQSKAGRGTNFVVWMPILEIDFDEVAAHDNEVPDAYGQILIVEDEELVRVAVSRMLSAWGHRVTAAATGREAMDLFRPGAFDLVICDLGLPDIQGWDVLRYIRDQQQGIKTILLTGWARQIDPAEARLKGVDMVVSKPFEQLTLRKTVGHMLAGSLDMTPRIIAWSE